MKILMIGLGSVSYTHLGNVRSCRDYYVYWALEWDPILVHFGGPYYLADIINRPDVNNITGCAVNSTSSAPGCNAFYRTSDKPVPHNAYTSGANLVEQCDSCLLYTSIR